MKRTVLIAVMVVALVLGLVAYAGAATTGTVNVTAAVAPVLTLTINGVDASAAPQSVSFNVMDPEAWTAGSADVTLRVKANREFDLGYAASDFTSGALSMPVSVMSWSPDAGATKTAFANSAQLTNEGAKGNTTYDHSYHIRPGLTYDPATYTTSVVYTLTVD